MVKFRHIAVVAMLAALMTVGCRPETVEPVKSSLIDTEQVEARAKSTKGSGQTALWVGSDEDTQIYLFGTLHNIRQNAAWKTAKIETAFESAHTLILETDLTSEDAQATMAIYRDENGELPADESLYNHLDTGDAYRLKALIKNLGEEPNSFGHLQPWLATLRISQLQKEKAGFGDSVDTVFEQMAREAGKTITYLEPVHDQMQLFDEASFRTQINHLNQVTLNLDRSLKHMELIASEWLDGDIDGLGLLVANPEFGYDAESYATILIHRNQKWAEKIAPMLEKPGTYFVAVGAAHLAGPDSLIFMLEDKKIRMERVQ